MDRKSTGSNRQHLIAFAMMLGLLVGGIAKTEAAPYKFTKIADTAGDFSDFFNNAPALNDNGVVTFSAKLDSGPSGVFTGEGTGTTTIADSSGDFNIFDFISPSLSDSGVLAFKVFFDAGGNAIVRSDRTTPIARNSLFKGHPSINDEGLVAFFQQTSLFIKDIVVSDGTTTTTIAPTPTTPFSSLGENPSLSDRGAVAFSDAVGSGIFRRDGTTDTVIARGPLFSLGFFPSLNNEGAVAFFARLDAGGSGIFVGNGTTTTTIADSSNSSPFLAFRDAPSINDKGVVAFWASLKMVAGGGHGIFTGPDPVAHKVIAAGDALDGSTVSDLTFGTFGREGLNNAGQVAFRARLVDGRQGIYRADPVPSNVPPDCSAVQATPGTLRPPDHTFGTVAITGVTDPDNNPVVITVTSIRQDEPVKGRGDGNTAPDGVGVGSPLVMVRAERSGRGDGRVYHVSFMADDGQSGQCTGEVVVCVPHDQRPGAVCVDQGALYDSTVDPEGPGS